MILMLKPFEPEDLERIEQKVIEIIKKKKHLKERN